MYKTKTQKKNALVAIDVKARKLFIAGVLSNQDVTKISDICKRAHRKL